MRAGVDYTAASGTLTFLAGETEKTVQVAILDDAHDHGGETLTLTLSNPVPAAYVRLGDATATGTIWNSDDAQRAWLARFGRTVAEQVDLTARTLAAHADDDVRQWGVSGAVALAPGADGRGLSFALRLRASW